jgi:hypothetical protein
MILASFELKNQKKKKKKKNKRLDVFDFQAQQGGKAVSQTQLKPSRSGV